MHADWKWHGGGWKVSPSIEIAAGGERLLCDIEGPGALQQIWCVVRMCDGGINFAHLLGRSGASVGGMPAGRFFRVRLEPIRAVSSLAVCVNPGSAFNCYWEMPFRKRSRITWKIAIRRTVILYYQINYTLTEVPDAAYFHAQFRRTNPLP